MHSDIEKTQRRPRVLILTPVYNEEQSLLSYKKAIDEVLFPHTGYDFEVLLIDDGSVDRSWNIIREYSAADSRFRGIRLSRNFGSHTAISAGFDRADADAVAVLPCDLQDPPELILEFLEKWESGAKIVWGRRKSSELGFVTRTFYGLMHRYASPKGARFSTGSFFLVDKKVADCFRRFPERNRLTFAMMSLTGFEQDSVEYSRVPRAAGRSGWTAGGKFAAFLDAFYGYSILPVRITALLCAGVSVFFATLAAYYLFCVFTGVPPMKHTALLLALSFFLDMQLFSAWFIGEYLYRILTETIRRPLYFESENTFGDGESKAAGLGNPEETD
jgi:polyisoprenyl-phosphate glycosyltransferase